MIAIALAGLLSVSLPPDSGGETIDLREFFGDLRGGFVLLTEGGGPILRYNPTVCSERHSPASTFKIVNAAIGLETGVVPDEHFTLPWDSTRYEVDAWNRDHDLASAMSASAVWYYQELARRIGRERMAMYVRRIRYGNADVSGPLDRFWLGSTLEISANEQVTFLRELARGTLPLSERSMEIVRRILVNERSDSAVVYAKTGLADEKGGGCVGWYVGWVQKRERRSIFALVLVSRNADRDLSRIMAMRRPTAFRILRHLGVL